jgi:hypothetical protein
MAQQSTAGKVTRPAAAPEEGAVVSVGSARRLVLVLLAFWTAIWALSLLLGAEAGSLSAGIEEASARRLLGVHILVLAPLYALLGWNPTKYRVFLWVPYVSQAGITAVTLFDAKDSLLPLVVGIIFLALLVFLWQAARKPAPAIKAVGTGTGGAVAGSQATTPPGQKAE